MESLTFPAVGNNVGSAQSRRFASAFCLALASYLKNQPLREAATILEEAMRKNGIDRRNILAGTTAFSASVTRIRRP
jgi:hypothetical protein